MQSHLTFMMAQGLNLEMADNRQVKSRIANGTGFL